MGFAKESGYIPASIEDMMLSVMENVNTQFGTSYTAETFIGTNFYKFFYAVVQRLQQSEVKTAEIFLKLQDYFRITNEAIARPKATAPGVIKALEDAGYISSVKPPENADAGKIFIAVDVDETADDYAATKLAINTIIKDSVAGGIVSQGAEVSTIVLSNGQSFDFKYTLPDREETLLRLTITTSENNQFSIKSPEEIKAILLANIAAKYRLGRNFEPQRYCTIVDAPWAASVLLEWSIDAGSSWHDEVYDAAYDDLFEVSLANTTLIEA